MGYTRSKPILPKIIAIDEADLLLELDKNVAFHTNKVLEKIKADGKKAGNQAKFIITGSSFPHKMNWKKKDREETKFVLQQKFQPIELL